MKVFHIRYVEPIGASWIAYTRPPILIDPQEMFLKSWVEEIELVKLTQEFIQYVIGERESGEKIHCLLEIRGGGKS